MFEGMYYGDVLVIPYSPGLTKRINIHAATHEKEFSREPTQEGLVVIRKADPLPDRRQAWPFRFMEVGDTTMFPSHRTKAGANAVAYGQSSGMRFKTKKQKDGQILVTRVK